MSPRLHRQLTIEDICADLDASPRTVGHSLPVGDNISVEMERMAPSLAMATHESDEGWYITQSLVAAVASRGQLFGISRVPKGDSQGLYWRSDVMVTQYDPANRVSIELGVLGVGQQMEIDALCLKYNPGRLAIAHTSNGPAGDVRVYAERAASGSREYNVLVKHPELWQPNETVYSQLDGLMRGLPLDEHPSGRLHHQKPSVAINVADMLRHETVPLEVVKEVLGSFALNGIGITEPLGSFASCLQKAKRLLEIYEVSPEVAATLVEHHISGVQGSNSSTLLDVLEHGLTPETRMQRQGRPMMAGEQHSSVSGAGDSISFSDWTWPYSIERYADVSWGPVPVEQLKADAETRLVSSRAGLRLNNSWHQRYLNGVQEAEEDLALVDILEADLESLQSLLTLANFPIAYGFNAMRFVDAEGDSGGELSGTSSDIIGEFIVRGEAALDCGAGKDLPLIFVPKARLLWVRSIVAEAGKKVVVLPLEPLVDSRRRVEPRVSRQPIRG